MPVVTVILSSAGLSPLARGTQEKAAGTQTQFRFIPAGAGNTYQAIADAVYCAVYPRWRGEHSLYEGILDLAIGLS
ncbi:hypothetical protein GU39_22850, partial [Salmonella enterica subsp. enterica serovar Bareilly str. CFSAN000229]